MEDSCFVGELDGELLVAFAGDAECPPFELQRAVMSGSQDRALGQDVHWLSVEGTSYGAVARWQVEGGLLVFDLTYEASSVLGVPRVIQTAISARAAAQLAQILPRMLAPSPAA